MRAGRSGMQPSTLAALKTRTPLLWLNPDRGQPSPVEFDERGGGESLADAGTRFARARALLVQLFPEMAASDGVVDSPLLEVPRLQQALGLDATKHGQLFLKADHTLPVAGSIKARGGFHEVLAHAESLAIARGLCQPGADLSALASPAARAFFATRTIAVGSTGNLGLSIGILSASLGFKAVVHMSHDAKAWKKKALRNRGVHVVEHTGDYATAVAAGRQDSERDPNSYFVDDENSPLLFMGYAAAARQLAAQLQAVGRTPTPDQPLLVYIPCGVGGAPGGIAFGLNRLFGAHVHCFFAEPVASPCMLVQLAAGLQAPASVYDFGLDNRTHADGLAVPQASMRVAAAMTPILSGVFTVTDEQLFAGVLQAWQTEALEIEPSAAAGFYGPQWIVSSDAGQRYLAERGLASTLGQATHVVWTTGGALVPPQAHHDFREAARLLEAGS